MHYFVVWPTSTLKLLRLSHEPLTVSALSPRGQRFLVVIRATEMGSEMDQATTGVRQNPGQYHPGQSGNPLGPHAVVKERVDELVAAMAADLGELTGIDSVVLRQAARLLVRAERTKNPDIAVRASNAASRMLATLQRKRHKRGRPPLRELAEAEPVG